MNSNRWRKGALVLLCLGIALLFLSGISVQDSPFVLSDTVQTPIDAQFHKISSEKLRLYEATKQIKLLEAENAALVRFFKMDYHRILEKIRRLYGSDIKLAANKYGLTPNLIAAVIAVESGGKRRATARHGEKGLMQLRPIICKLMQVKDPFDPKQNIFAGAAYLNQLLKEFDHDMTLALAAYNAGPTIVRHYKGMPPWIHTEYYVQKILFLSQAASL